MRTLHDWMMLAKSSATLEPASRGELRHFLTQLLALGVGDVPPRCERSLARPSAEPTCIVFPGATEIAMRAAALLASLSSRDISWVFACLVVIAVVAGLIGEVAR